MRNKILFILLLYFPLASLAAGGFSLSKTQGEYFLTHITYGITKLELEGPGLPKILESKEHSLFDIVVIDHGEVGTSCLVRIQKAYVFNKSKRKFIGVYPYRVVAVENKVKKCKVKPIIWETYKNFILIDDKNSGEKIKITP